MKTPVVEFLTPDKTKKSDQQDYTSDDLFEMSMANVINNAGSANSDMWLGTPVTMKHVLSKRDKFAPYDINPEYVIIDECDLLLDPREGRLRECVHWILKKFASQNADQKFAGQNLKRRFIFAGSTMPEELISTLE